LLSSYVDSYIVSRRYCLLVNVFPVFVLLDSFYLEKVTVLLYNQLQVLNLHQCPTCLHSAK
jgi:hypothetical protein